jgi:glycosyltransferase involved in cell wall biosynthesis
MIFFSVIIPTYNRELLLKRSISSVLNQTFDNFELLIIDNGSTDNTEQVVLNFKDDRIKYFKQSNSGSPASPRNSGISRATGIWIAFLDSDDLWYPEKLAEVYKICELKDYDVIVHGEKHVDIQKHTEKDIYYHTYDDDIYKNLLTKGNFLSTSATCVRRYFLDKHKLFFDDSPGLFIVEDYDLWLRIALNGGRFYTLNQILGEYLINETSMINNIELMKNNHFNLYKKHAYNIQNFTKDKNRLYKNLELNYLNNYVIMLFLQGYYFDCLKIMLYILIKNPFSFIIKIIHRVIKK